MHKYSELGPWILGAIATATAAAVISVGGNVGAPKPLQPPAAIAEILPGPSAILTNSPAQLRAEPAPVPVAQARPAGPESQTVSPVAQPAAPAGQIWECTTNGQKTFANNPCGEKSSLREFGPINTMEATPVSRYLGAYQPEAAYYAPDRDDNAPQDSADEPYQSQLGLPYFVHRRGERVHRPYQRGSGPAPRRN